MKILLILAVVFAVLANLTKGQSSSNLKINDELPVSPNASSFSRYGGYSSELYTGNVPISIPIYTIKDGDISLPVSLNTVTGAIKVAEIPGWVGSGWNLTTGGVITRRTNGMPDDFKGGLYNVGYFYNLETNETILSKLTQGEGLTQAEFDAISGNELDIESDEYYFNLPGYSGRFMYILDTLVVFPKQNIKVEKLWDSGGEGFIETWILTTPDGVKYIFKAIERIPKNITYGLETITCSVATTWYLESIVSPRGGAINIEYYEKYGKRRHKSYNDRDDWWVYYGQVCVGPAGEDENINTVPISYVKKITTTDSEVSFVLGEREDVLPETSSGFIEVDWKLDTIKLYNTNELVKMWNLTYYTAISAGDNIQRLQLASLTELSSNNTPGGSYSFIYNSKIVIPYSSRSIDHWGYYNGQPNTSLIPSTLSCTREPYYLYGAIGTLTGITYPTGGSTTFVYEPNDYSYINNTVLNTNYFSYEYDNTLTVTLTSVEIQDEDYQGPTYTFNDSMLIDITYACACEGEDPSACVEGCRTDGSLETYHSVSSYKVPAGSLTINGNFLRNHLPIAEESYYLLSGLYVSVTFSKRQVNDLIGLRTGGLRIKEIINYDGNKYETREYSYRIPDDPNRSSGVIGTLPIYTYDITSQLSLSYPVTEAVIKQGTGITEVSCTQNSHIGYSVVSEFIGDNIHTDYYFTSFKEYGDLIQETGPGGFPGMLAPLFTRDYMRGKIKKKNIFLNDNLLQSQIYNYTNVTEKEYIKWHPYIYKWVQIPYPVGGELYTPEIDVYYKCLLPLEHFQLSGTEQTDYDNEGIPLITTPTSYDYTDYLVPRRQAVTNSDGNILKTEYTYPFDYMGYQNWLDANIYNTVVSESQYKNNQLIEKVYNGYTSFNPDFTIRETNHNGSMIGDTLVHYDLWDTGNHIVQYHKRGAYYTNIWDTSVVNLVARFDNAKRSQVYYESFEELDDNNVVTNKENARSGERYLNDGSYTITGFSPEGGVDYKMSYWYFNQSSGWHKVKTTYQSTISIDGTRIDDIIICPARAIPHTYTYKPLIGMTSETDINGVSLFYEYDSLGRLIRVKDNDGNILKTYDYHYKH